MSDERTRTLAEMQRIVSTLNEAKERAARAQRVMDDCAQRVLSAIDDMENWSYRTFHQAAETAQRVRGNVLYAIETMPVACRVYGDAMEIGQRAATGMVIQSDGSANDLPHQAIAAAALAQMSWAEASGNAVSAQATLQESLQVPSGQMSEGLKTARAQMAASDTSNGDAMAATARVEQCVQEYQQTI